MSLPVETEAATVVVKLSHEQLLERCDELSLVLEQLEAIREEKAAAVADFKARMEPLTSRAAELHRVIRERAEERLAQRNLFGETTNPKGKPLKKRRHDGRAAAAGRAE
jgi:hypothetical protein